MTTNSPYIHVCLFLFSAGLLANAQSETLYGLPPLPLTEEELATSTKPTTTTTTARPIKLFTFAPILAPPRLPTFTNFDAYYGINPVPELPPRPESKAGGYYDNDGNFIKFGKTDGKLPTGRSQNPSPPREQLKPASTRKRREAPEAVVLHSSESNVPEHVHSADTLQSDPTVRSASTTSKQFQAPTFKPSTALKPTQLLRTRDVRPTQVNAATPQRNNPPPPKRTTAHSSAVRTNAPQQPRANVRPAQPKSVQPQRATPRPPPATTASIPFFQRLSDLLTPAAASSLLGSGSKSYRPINKAAQQTITAPRNLGTTRAPALLQHTPKRFVPEPPKRSGSQLPQARPLVVQQPLPQQQIVQQRSYRPQYANDRDPAVESFMRDLEEYDWRLYYKEEDANRGRFFSGPNAPRASGDPSIAQNVGNSARLYQLDAEGQEVEQREHFLRDPPQLHMQLPSAALENNPQFSQPQTQPQETLVPLSNSAVVPQSGTQNGNILSNSNVNTYSNTYTNTAQSGAQPAAAQQPYDPYGGLFSHHFAGVTPHPLFSMTPHPHPLFNLFNFYTG